MRSYQFREYGQDLERVESATPEPHGKEVVVRVDACGVCHSDLHVWQGYFEMGNGKRMDISSSRELPFTLGHEIVGEVVAIGPDAGGVGLGDRRVAFPWIGCGECDLCAAGHEHHCLRSRALGTHVDGGFSDHVVVPHAKYLFDYGDVDPNLACTYACSGLAAYSALGRITEQVHDNLVLIGAGGLGFAGLSLAQVLSDAPITVVDIDEKKLERAKEAGAASTVNANDTDAAKQLRRATGGGADAVVDFVGSEATASLGVRILAKRGVLVVVGLFGGAVTVPLPLFSLKHISILGSALGSLQEMSALMEIVRGGTLPPIPIETRPLETAQQSLRDLEEGRVIGRVVLTPEGRNYISMTAAMSSSMGTGGVRNDTAMNSVVDTMSASAPTSIP